MPVHDDHSRAHDEAHVLSLRLALGSILSPKRPQMTRSTTNSGTTSPAVHCPHSAIPLSPSHSNSSAHPASHTPPVHPMSAPPHAHLPHQPHPHHPHAHVHPHQTHHPHAPSHLHTSYQPGMPGGESSLHDDVHPHMPDAVAAPIPTAPSSGAVTPNSRAHFLETLQSKKSWDALIHGSWM